MDPADRIPDDDVSLLKAILKDAATAQRDRDILGRQAPAAVLRLVKAIYPDDSSQSSTVAACLASVYNGGDALPVRLDEIRWLDWALQRDLAIVILGTGNAGFEDSHIRAAFHEVGGDAAVEWFHWHTTGGAHKRALERLTAIAVCNPKGPVSAILRSLVGGGPSVALAKLGCLEKEEACDITLLLSGLFGRDRGAVKVSDVVDALKRSRTKASSRPNAKK